MRIGEVEPTGQNEFGLPHFISVAVTDPTGQKYPASQLEEQSADVSSWAPPNLPAGHISQLT